MPKYPVVDQTARFFSKVNSRGVCWEWEGSLTSDGYGRHWIGSKGPMAHRWIWEHLVGPIPEGYEIDHLCLNTRCVNPDHLEPVTGIENMRRKKSDGAKIGMQRRTHCRNGHPMVPDNLYEQKARRRCKICTKNYNRDRYLRYQEKYIAEARVRRS